MNIISATFTFFCILFGFISLSYSVLKNKQHIKLCDAFHDRFGYLPADIVLAQAGGVFLTFQKDFYFIAPLIVKKNSYIVRGMKSEHYDFIRSQPHEMTSWLKIKFTLLLVTIMFFFATIVTSYFFE